MGVLLLRPNDLPPLRVLYFCLLTYSSNVKLPSSYSVPRTFFPSLIRCPSVNCVLCNVYKGRRRILPLSTVWTRGRGRSAIVNIYRKSRCLAPLTRNGTLVMKAIMKTEDILRPWGYG